MNWNKDKRSTALSPESSKKSGSWCIFIQLSDTEGVKLYHRKDIRDRAAELQREAYDLGLAPAVGEPCELPYLESWGRCPEWPAGEPELLYGYITEIAQDVGEPSDEEYAWLADAMREYDLSVHDLHAGNMGKVNGWPVCIDFDPIFYGREFTFKEQVKASEAYRADTGLPVISVLSDHSW